MASKLFELKRLFPNRAWLHQRIDTLLSGSDVVRVGIVPHASTRQQISPVLNVLVADPIDDAKWFKPLEMRALTKDVFVTQSSAFNQIAVHNSSIEYAVPFKGPPTVFVETSSATDSAEHLASCHLHLFASVHPAESLITPVPSEHPRLVVLDSSMLLEMEETRGTLHTGSMSYTGDRITIDAKAARQAEDVLRASPANASAYNAMHKASNVPTLKKAVFNAEKIRAALYGSIINTCRKIVEEGEVNVCALSKNTKDIMKLRADWAAHAHEELQGTLVPRLRDLLHHELAWYKLYYKTDDVEAIAAARVGASFLPETRNGLLYLLGRIDTIATGTSADTCPQQALAEAYDRTMQAVADLHNAALESVLAGLVCVQLPLCALALGGVWFLDLSFVSMGSLAALGIVAGLRQIQSLWLAASQRFRSSVATAAREGIAGCEERVWDMFEQRVVQQKQLLREQAALLAELEAPPAPKRQEKMSSSPFLAV